MGWVGLSRTSRVHAQETGREAQCREGRGPNVCGGDMTWGWREEGVPCTACSRGVKTAELGAVPLFYPILMPSHPKYHLLCSWALALYPVPKPPSEPRPQAWKGRCR